MNGLEDKSKGALLHRELNSEFYNCLKFTYQFFKYSLDQRCKSYPLGRLGVPDVLAEDGDSLGVGLTLEHKPTLLQNKAEFTGIGHDTIVDNDKLVSSAWLASGLTHVLKVKLT
jgi:hypothetical protein